MAADLLCVRPSLEFLATPSTAALSATRDPLASTINATFICNETDNSSTATSLGTSVHAAPTVFDNRSWSLRCSIRSLLKTSCAHHAAIRVDNDSIGRWRGPQVDKLRTNVGPKLNLHLLTKEKQDFFRELHKLTLCTACHDASPTQ